MDVSLPTELSRALEADEAEELGEIIRGHRVEHFDVLRKLVSLDPDVSAEHRRKALYALGRWGDPSVIPDIERVLPNLEEGGRIAGINALGELGTDQALQVVARYGRDPSSQVRKVVVEALGRIGGAEAQRALRAIAEEDPEEWVRRLAARHAYTD